MFDLDDEDRVRRIETRLNQLERLVKKLMPDPAATGSVGANAETVPRTAAPPPPQVAPRSSQAPGVHPGVRKPGSAVQSSARPSTGGEDSMISPTTILGWTGVTSVVLAAVYLIRLAIDSGWLTPIRQIGLAALSGVGLVVIGLALRRFASRYAGLLPAGGIVILYLSTYGAHLYYPLLDEMGALALVVLISLSALWLGKTFESDLYVLFAAVGSYAAPFLLQNLRGDIGDLVIYFSAWNLVFCLYAVRFRNRIVYLLALYLALISFDVIWKTTASNEWIAAMVFQFIQFFLFSGFAVVYSIRDNAPMREEAALAHLPPLLVFYAIQYALLKEHLPSYAPWVALSSLGFLAGCYGVARRYLGEIPEAGKLLVSGYAALVLFHAGYLESVPGAWAPWLAFVLVLAALSLLTREDGGSVGWPLLLAFGLVFVINFLRIATHIGAEDVPGKNVLAVLYTAELYLAYYLIRSHPSIAFMKEPLLYAGHISAMAAAVHMFDNRFAISCAWGLVALGCLTTSLKVEDKTLGQSSLLVFAASAAKLFLYDLSGSAPLVRIASLLALGGIFYLGGWLYQRVNTLPA